MSSDSFEALETDIRRILSSHGPLTEDELLKALLADGIDLSSDPEDQLGEILDEGDELLVVLIDERWVWLPALLDGRVFTHRLSDLEAEHDMLDFGADLAPLSILTENESYHRLVNGSTIMDVLPGLDDDVLAQRGMPQEALDDEGAWLLEPGTLLALGAEAGDLVGLRVAMTGFELVTVDNVAECKVGVPLSELLEENFDRPQSLGLAIWTVCAADDDLFREPAAPLGQLLEVSGLPHWGDLVARRGFSFESWQVTHRIRTVRARYGLHDDEAFAVLGVLLSYEKTRELVDVAMNASEGEGEQALAEALSQLPQEPIAVKARWFVNIDPERTTLPECLKLLEEPAVAEAVLSEILSGDERAPLALSVFAETVEPSAPRSARAALRWLRGKAYEQLGDVEKAELRFQEAERLAPSWPLTLMSLARYASDRGDAERGLALLRRANAPHGHPLVALLEQFQSSPRPKLARNQPCWCGSGRKYKQCHLHGEQLPLEARASWLYQKACGDLIDGPYAPLLIAAAQERSKYWDTPDALAQAIEDGHPCDVVLFEGGVFDEFLAMRGPLLPPDEAMLAQQWLLVDRSVHEVLSVRPGESMEWRDVRTGDVNEIRERTASQQVKRGEFYCARVVPVGETMQIFGGLEPVSLGERDQLIALLDDDPDPIELVAFLSRRFAPPVLRNTEQEPLVMCHATLRVTDPATLASALDAAYNRDVDAPADTLRWFEHVETHGVERIRSELHITTDELSVHANSETRFDRTIATIRRLDPSATLTSETREPAGDLRAMQESAASSSRPPAELLDPASDPAVAAALKEMVLNFEEAWLDDTIPALSGYTPRQCAQDPTRRPDLIRLLDSFPEADGQPGQMSPARLRARLGLD